MRGDSCREGLPELGLSRRLLPAELRDLPADRRQQRSPGRKLALDRRALRGALPHSSYAQYGMGTPVSRDQLQPGDLVFFDGLGHEGIYVGGGSFIHSPHTGDVVKISSMTGWYASTYVGARRL